MEAFTPQAIRYLIFFLLSALTGALLALRVTHVLPKMMSQMMCAMMENMRIQMGGDALTPEEV
jgi:hypothetical protein